MRNGFPLRDIRSNHREHSPLLRLPEAAKWLGVSERTLYTLRKNGDIADVRVGSGGVRIAIEELQRYVKENTVRFDQSA